MSEKIKEESPSPQTQDEPARERKCDRCDKPATWLRAIHTSGYNSGSIWNVALCDDHCHIREPLDSATPQNEHTREQPSHDTGSPFAGGSESQKRDRDWILALAYAAGTNSGLNVPLLPEPELVADFLVEYAQSVASQSTGDSRTGLSVAAEGESKRGCGEPSPSESAAIGLEALLINMRWDRGYGAGLVMSNALAALRDKRDLSARVINTHVSGREQK